MVNDGIFCCYFQNFNGINLNNNGAEFLDELAVLKELGASLIGSAEPNVNWKRGNLFKKAKEIIRKWAGHTCSTGEDPLGRWSWITLQGKQKRLVTFLTAYQVCDNNLANKGPSTCWMQQWGGLKKKGVTKLNPRQQFLTDLFALIEELQGNNHEIVLLLDANKDILDNGQFTKFFKDNDLVDAYHHLHPQSNPATYLRGHKRLDYMLLTPGLTPALRSIGYLPFHTGIFLDHCALYADFDPEILFLGDLSSFINPATRRLKATNPKKSEKLHWGSSKSF
eukprot:3875079-Ditylum_brightwellii.AAC.2